MYTRMFNVFFFLNLESMKCMLEKYLMFFLFPKSFKKKNEIM